MIFSIRFIDFGEYCLSSFVKLYKGIDLWYLIVEVIIRIWVNYEEMLYLELIFC